MKKKKIDLIITSCLSRITDFQIMSENKDLFDEVEDFREYIVNYKNRIKDYCETCGCNEFLCGHNKRE